MSRKVGGGNYCIALGIGMFMLQIVLSVVVGGGPSRREQKAAKMWFSNEILCLFPEKPRRIPHLVRLVPDFQLW